MFDVNSTLPMIVKYFGSGVWMTMFALACVYLSSGLKKRLMIL